MVPLTDDTEKHMGRIWCGEHVEFVDTLYLKLREVMSRD